MNSPSISVFFEINNRIRKLLRSLNTAATVTTREISDLAASPWRPLAKSFRSNRSIPLFHRFMIPFTQFQQIYRPLACPWQAAENSRSKTAARAKICARQLLAIEIIILMIIFSCRQANVQYNIPVVREVPTFFLDLKLKQTGSNCRHEVTVCARLVQLFSIRF